MKIIIYIGFVFFHLIFFTGTVKSQVQISTADYDLYLFDTLLIDASQMVFVPKLTKDIQKTLTYKIKSDGIKTYHFINGNKFSKGRIENKMKEGDWLSWYDSGLISNKVFYVKNIREGNCTYWYSNGNLNAKGQYKNDLKEGDWIFYNPDGSYKGNFTYLKGVLIK